MYVSILKGVAIFLLVWLLLIISGLILFSIFIGIGFCIKECIIPITKKICSCIICISKNENKEEINKKVELV